MKPPTRLIEDPALAPELRADLDALQRSAPDFDEAAGLLAFQAAVVAASAGAAAAASANAAGSALAGGAASAGVSAGVSSGGASAVVAVAGWSTAAKLGAAALSSTVIALAVVTGARWSLPATPAPVEKAPALEVQAAAPVVTTPAPVVAAPVAVVPALEEALVPPPDLARAGRAKAERALEREVAWMASVKARIEREPREALRLIEQAERELSSAALVEEREALRVLALWNAGERDAARAHAKVFVSRYPRSPARGRIERTLAEGP